MTEALELVSQLPPKDDRTMQLEQLRGMRLIERNGGDHWSITNRAAILFARKLADFGVEYERRAPRVILYKGDDLISTEREQTGVAVMHSDLRVSSVGSSRDYCAASSCGACSGSTDRFIRRTRSASSSLMR